MALLRRWFWTRKPDAGFLLKDFPATLLQALVFDEWLDARNETLDAVITLRSTPVDLSRHYQRQGVAVTLDDLVVLG